MHRARAGVFVVLTTLVLLGACGVAQDGRTTDPSVLPLVERPLSPGSATAAPDGVAVTVTVTPSTSPEPTATPSPSPEPSSTPSATPVAPEPTTTSGPVDPPAEPPSEREQLEAEVVELTNAERVAAGCPEVHVDDQLTTASRGHSEDMVERDFFDHTNPDGDGPGARARAAGYDWRAISENIAWGYRTAEAVVAGWMDSPGHRRNILDCDAVEIGVGVADSSGGPYWTQMFGRR